MYPQAVQFDQNSTNQDQDYDQTMAQLDFLDDSDFDEAELSLFDDDFEEAQDNEENQFWNPFSHHNHNSSHNLQYHPYQNQYIIN